MAAFLRTRGGLYPAAPRTPDIRPVPPSSVTCPYLLPRDGGIDDFVVWTVTTEPSG
jgi:hypothetical protein